MLALFSSRRGALAALTVVCLLGFGFAFSAFAFSPQVNAAVVSPDKNFESSDSFAAVSTRTPTKTRTPLPPTKTATRTRTATPLPPTNTPTRTRTATALPPTKTPTKTNTPLPPTKTPTRTRTATPAPPTNTPTPVLPPGVTLDSIWIANLNETPVTTLNPGDSFYFMVRILNGEPAAQAVSLRWQLAGPCGQTRNMTSNESAPQGIWVREFYDTLPTNCAGAYTFTFTLTWNENVSSQSTGFTVTGPTPTPTLAPTATTVPIVAIDAVWTADESNAPQTTFHAGDVIRYYATVENPTGMAQTVGTSFRVTGPCDYANETNLDQNISANPTSTLWALDFAPSCAGDYVYAFALTWNGETTEQSVTFTVIAPADTPTPAATEVPGSVNLLRVWTADSNGAEKTVFASGEAIQYFATIDNSMGAAESISARWNAVSPCGTIANWTFALTAEAGTTDQYLPLTLPSACSGAYTYTFTLTWNGTPVSQAVTFTVE